MKRVVDRETETDQLLWDLVTTGRETRRLAEALESATVARNQVIHRAWLQGISARLISRMTQLSHARIQQIVDERDDRHERTIGGVPPHPRRQDRHRSRQLLSHFEAQQQNVLSGLRERVERRFTPGQLTQYVSACRAYQLSWHEIADALGMDEQSALERFGCVDEVPAPQELSD